MTAFGSTTFRGVAGSTTNAPSGHVPSHARLLRSAPRTPVDLGRQRYRRPDAIIVPATRPASALAGIIELTAALESTIVVLCSRQAKVDQVAERIGRVVGARGIVVEIDEGYRLPGLTLGTSSADFISASAHRASDLSVKRNVGLLLARQHGWHKIAFVDDDITMAAQDLVRLGHQLDHHQIAGMACRDYPDNSVFCHARRLARMPQDVFVTGAVLGVNCDDLPLPFFPDIYNEDWFFFAEAAAHRRLTKVGDARQAPYNPYANPARAGHEEFGDLLAEGLYALIEKLHVPVDLRHPDGFLPSIASMATEKYWSTYIDVRRIELIETWSSLDDFTRRDNCSDDVYAALKSLETAEERYVGAEHRITPRQCVAFLDALQGDIARWNKIYQRTNTLRSTGDAMKSLGIGTWVPVRVQSSDAVSKKTACLDDRWQDRAGRGPVRHESTGEARASHSPGSGAVRTSASRAEGVTAQVNRDEDAEAAIREVLICYRRGDAQDVAGRIFDRLEHEIGKDRVFMDVNSIPLGADFDEEIRHALALCKVLVVLIGRRWLRSTHQGRRRLDDPNDRVVAEIRAALDREMLIFPVLVGGARMPSEKDLPDGIRELAKRQAVPVDHETFDRDVIPLVQAVRRAV